MSLESIHRVISHAYKAASDTNTGTADEKGAVDVLGGLMALLESRLHLHKQAAPTPAVAAAGSPAAPRPATSNAGIAPASPDSNIRKPPTPSQADDSYELK